LQRESVRSFESSIRGREKITHQAYIILKNLQRKKVTNESLFSLI